MFPFHFTVDGEMRIVSAGSALRRICPNVTDGAEFSRCFTFSRFGMLPTETFDGQYILKQRSTLFIFAATCSALVLRMQVLVLENPTRYCFIGSPWVRTPAEMRALNIVLNDFALHDATVDLLQLVQSTDRAIEDARRLTSKFEVQRNDLEQLIDTANAPIVGVDAAGCVLVWNQSMARITGIEKHDALKTHFASKHVSEACAQSVESMIASAVRGELTPVLEFELNTKCGDRRLVICSVSPRHDAAGGVVGAILVGQDITELGEYRSTLEQRVEQRTAQLSQANAELSRAMRSKDDFLSAMSHELRTPLTAVIGLSELLVEGVYGPLGTGQTKPIATIAESGQHLLSLINDLLDVAKIGAGKVELNWGDAEVREVCDASLRLVAQMAQKKHQVLSTRLDAAAPSIRVDERRLKQILVNLLSNAVKFTPDSGSITLETHADMDAGTLTFAVHDTGIGIADEDITRLFTPFTQLDSRLARQYAGTGLGLTLVMLLTEQHGGHVSVTSQVGKGSTFSAVLPWHPTAPRASSPASDEARADVKGATPPALSDTGPVIINADDSESCRMTIGDFLRGHGYRVVDAHNGAEAIAAVFEHHPVLVLMDLQMPQMDGLSAIRLLRSNAVSADLPLIALTSRRLADDRAQCLAAGADEFMSKPVNLPQLLATIGRLTGANSA